MASVKQRSGNWHVRWRMGGRGGKEQSLTLSDEKLAQQAADIAKAHQHKISDRQVSEAILGPSPEPEESEQSTPPVREFAEAWLTAHTSITPGSEANHRSRLKRVIIPLLGEKQLHEIKGSDVATMVAHLKNLGRARQTIEHYFNTLHAMLGFAVREKLISENPATPRKKFVEGRVAHDDDGDDGDEHVYLSKAEYLILLAAFHDEDKPFVEFLMGTGVRFSEGAAVAAKAINASKGKVRIHRAFKRDRNGRQYLGSTKTRERRTVPVGTRTIKAIQPLLDRTPPEEILFRGPKGGVLNNANYLTSVWNPAVARAMRCPEHPPATDAKRVEPGRQVGPRCRDNGGTRGNGKPCGAKVSPGWDRCWQHIEPSSFAVSTCDCPTLLTRRPTPHDLRHTYVSWQLATGKSLAVIAQIMGHSIRVAERIYAGLTSDMAADLGSMIDDMLGDPDETKENATRKPPPPRRPSSQRERAAAASR